MPSEGDLRKKLEQIKSQANNPANSEQRPTMSIGTFATFGKNKPEMHSGKLLNEGTDVDTTGKKPVG